MTATTATATAAGNWRTARDASGIVTVTLDVAGGGANVLSTKVMRELDDVVDAVAKDRAVSAVASFLGIHTMCQVKRYA